MPRNTRKQPAAAAAIAEAKPAPNYQPPPAQCNPAAISAAEDMVMRFGLAEAARGFYCVMLDNTRRQTTAQAFELADHHRHLIIKHQAVNS